MNKKAIVALLKKHGIEASESETEEQLQAKLDKIPTAAATPAQPAVPVATAGLANVIDLTAIQAQLTRERTARITAAIDGLIAAGKVTNDERDAEIGLCLANEERLTGVLAKRTAAQIGDAPGSPVIGRYGSEGARDHVMKMTSPQARFDHMRDNWDTLRASGYRKPGNRFPSGPMAANTTDADLVTDMLVEGATTILQNRLAALRAFSKEVSVDRLKPLAVLQHKKITAGGTVQENETNFEDTTNFVGTNVNVPITCAQLTVGGHITNAERQNGFRMADWVTIKTAEIGDAIMAKVAAVILEGTFTTHAPLVSAAAAFGSSELKTLWGNLKKAAIKNLILDGEYYAQLLPSTLENFNVLTTGMPGWDVVALNTNWTGATANTVGFACDPQAIVCGLGLPVRSERANMVSSETVLSLPGLGVSVAVYEWYSNISRADWTTYDIMFGAAANDTTAGQLIKSA
jgi:hypothetical protein